MVQVSTAQVPQPDDARDALVYLTLQELATRVSHRNTGKLIGDPVGYDLMSRVASDENLHHLFYRDVTAAAIELDPSGMVQAIERQVAGFAMPGIGIPDFDRHAAAHRPRRHLRLRRPPRPDPGAGGAAPVEGRRADRARRRRRGRARPAAPPDRAHRPPRSPPGRAPREPSCRRPRSRGAPGRGHRPHCRAMSQLSLDEVRATLTAPGAPFEMEEVVIRGVPTRTWKHAPPTLRAVLEASRAHGDRRSSSTRTSASPSPSTSAAAGHLAQRLRDRFGVRPRATGWPSPCATSRSGPSRSGPRPSAGAVVVPLNAWWTGPELEYGLEDSGSVVLFADAERAERLERPPARACRRCGPSIVARAEDAAALPTARCAFEDVARRGARRRPSCPRWPSIPRTTPRSSTPRARPAGRRAPSARTATSAPT